MSFADRMSRALGTAADAHEAELRGDNMNDLRRRIVSGVRRRRQMKVVGVVAAAVAVALVTVQVWPNSEVVDRPNIVPAETPSESKGQTDDKDFQAEFCATQDFVAGYLPERFASRYSDAPKPDDFPGALRVFRAEGRPNHGTHITLFSEPPYAQGSTRVVPVVDGVGSLGEIEEGYSVEFEYQDCDFTLEAFGVDESEFESFVRNISPAGNPFAALWPEDTMDDYREACLSDGSASVVDGPEAVVRDFFDVVIGTPVHQITEQREERGHGGRYYQVENTDGLDFEVLMGAFLEDCWTITHVQSPGSPADWPLSVGVGNPGPDDMQIGGGSPPGSVSKTIEIGYGGQVHSGEAAAEGVFETQLPFPHNVTGHLLLLYYDTEGQLQGVLGTTLPPGDFAAG